MLRNKDILEIKRRFKKDACTITRMCGCYVDSNKEKVMKLDENFLNLDDEEFFKYLEIVKKAVSGTIGNNLLDLQFQPNELKAGGKQQYFLGLRESGLKNPELLDHLYDMIIENYDYVGNYLILVFYDAYDVITKTNDELKLDESEEVFTYMICAICPVNLSKPGLRYNNVENNISPIVQDWVVGMPDVGFMYPSFIDRTTDVNTVTYYVRDTKDSHPDFVEDALGCESKRTATEEKKTFEDIVKTAIAPIIEKSDDVMLALQEQLFDIAEEKKEEEEGLVIGEPEEFCLDNNTVRKVLKKLDIPDSAVNQIQESIDEEFSDKAPVIEHLYDEKAIEKNNKEKKEQKLLNEIAELRSELNEAKNNSEVQQDTSSAGKINSFQVQTILPAIDRHTLLRIEEANSDQLLYEGYAKDIVDSSIMARTILPNGIETRKCSWKNEIDVPYMMLIVDYQ